MKKLFYFLPVIFIFFTARAQEITSETGTTPGIFKAGISYSYVTFDMKLHKMTIQSTWKGEDWGTRELTDDEIKEINTYADRLNDVNYINLQFGMSFIRNPLSKWQIEGMLNAGVAKIYSKVYNQLSENDEYIIKSDFSKPCMGLSLNVSYHLNPHWSVSARPIFFTTFGKTTDIEDNISGYPENTTRNIDDKYITCYERLNLYANYHLGNFIFSLGPGFYLVSTVHDYTLTIINNINGQSMIDEFKYTNFSRSYFDGSAAINWNFYKTLNARIAGGIGNDIMVNAGLEFSF